MPYAANYNVGGLPDPTTIEGCRQERPGPPGLRHWFPRWNRDLVALIEGMPVSHEPPPLMPSRSLCDWDPTWDRSHDDVHKSLLHQQYIPEHFSGRAGFGPSQKNPVILGQENPSHNRLTRHVGT
jgi:hypothetical protein